MLDNTKSNAARIPCGKCGGYVGGKLLRLPGEVLQTGSRESESRSNNELQEVSRSHSTLRNQEQSDQHLRSEGVQVSWILHREEWKRHLHPCAPKVAEQGKGKAETADRAQPRTQRPPSDGGSESVYPWMAWLLPCS